MAKLLMQTYIEDDIDRGTNFTYQPHYRLQRLSNKLFKRYAHMVGADYEYVTESSNPLWNNAHMLRMEMFNRPEYDEVLYIDNDILIHPRVFTEQLNIFELPGVAACSRLHYPPYQRCKQFNAGVTKWTQYECEIMKEHIDSFNTNDGRNQLALNRCYFAHVKDPPIYLPDEWNVTHKPMDNVLFEHYVGYKKENKRLKKDKLYRYWNK